MITPFFMGTVVGAIASGRVPVGNAEGDPWSSWLNPVSILVGVLFVATGAYLAAVFLITDARHAGDDDLVDYFRRRAYVTAIVTGAIALVGIFDLHADARFIYDGLTSDGLPLVILSAVCGLGALFLIHRGARRGARELAVGAVVAIIWGWGVAQFPYLLPQQLTISEGAGTSATLTMVFIVFGAAVLLVLPSLGYLYTLAQRRMLGAAAESESRGALNRGQARHPGHRGGLLSNAARGRDHHPHAAPAGAAAARVPGRWDATSIVVGFVLLEGDRRDRDRHREHRRVGRSGIDIAVGLASLALAWVAATGRELPFAARRAARKRKREEKKALEDAKDPWTKRILARDSLWLAFALGVGPRPAERLVPGRAQGHRRGPARRHDRARPDPGLQPDHVRADRGAADLLPAWRPSARRPHVSRFAAWGHANARQIGAWVAGVVGVYLVISGILDLRLEMIQPESSPTRARERGSP